MIYILYYVLVIIPFMEYIVNIDMCWHVQRIAISYMIKM